MTRLTLAQNDRANDIAMDRLTALMRLPQLLKDVVPAASLPAGLMEYGPARLWCQVTADYWEILAECSKTTPSPRDRQQLIPVEDWIAIRNDMVRSTGPTPWISDPGSTDPRVFFAGWTLRPVLREYVP